MTSNGVGLWREANIPQRHKLFKVEDNCNSAWDDAYTTISAGIGVGSIYVLCGPRGAGKTQIGVCLIRHACHLGLSSRYTKALDFYIELRESYGRNAFNSERDVLIRYTKYKYLVIDAIEERGDSVWENRMLSHLIDLRYDATADTILITNDRKSSLQKTLGPSVVSRIAEVGGAIECNWGSFRTTDDKGRHHV